MQVSVGSYLVDVPDVAVGAIGAALIGLMVAFVTLWNAHRQHNTKLEHDELQANRARQMQIRRDVYLPAAADISAFIGTLGRYTNLDFPEEKLIEQLERLSQATARIQLVAGDAALEACGKLHRALAVATFEIQRRRVSMQLRKIDIESKENCRRDLVRDINQIAQMLNQQGASKGLVGEQSSKVLRWFESAQANLENVTSELDALHGTQQHEHTQILRDLVTALMELSPKLPEFMAAVRRELESTDSLAVLEHQQKLTLEVVLGQLDKSLKQLQ